MFSPYALIWNRDFYYVVGWSKKHGKLAQFRVDRMTGIQQSDAAYIADPSFDPADYVRKVFGMYYDETQRVTLLCENRTMRSIIDRFGEAVYTETVDAKHFRAAVDVAPSPPFLCLGVHVWRGYPHRGTGGRAGENERHGCLVE